MNYKNMLNNYFELLKLKYFTIFDDFFISYNLPQKAVNALVIVEPRKHNNLEFVIKNACYYCRGWSLYIFHSEENKEFVKNMLGNNLKNVNLIEFTKSNINIKEYTDLLLSVEKFWNKIKANMVLIFQTDSCLKRFGIEKYLKYDYVGAPWEKCPVIKTDINFLVGNGGLSLRNKNKMIEIIKNHKNEFNFKARIDKDSKNEDLFFCYWATKLKFSIPKIDEATKFSVEEIYYNDSIGFHAPEIKFFFNDILSLDKGLLNFEIENDNRQKLLIIENGDRISKYNEFFYRLNYKYNIKIINENFINKIDIKVLVNKIYNDDNIFIIYLSSRNNIISKINNINSVNHLKIIINNFENIPNCIYNYVINNKNYFKQYNFENINYFKQYNFENINNFKIVCKNFDILLQNIKTIKKEPTIKIPKKIHQVWGYYDKVPPHHTFQKYINTWKKYNNDYEHKIWLRDDIEIVIKKYTPELWSIYDNLDQIIKKIDYSRLALLYIFGGIYSDIDFECLKNFDSILSDYELVLCCEKKGNISNAIMCAKKGNKLIYKMLLEVKKYSKQHVLVATGPQLVNKIIVENYKINNENMSNILIFPPECSTMIPYEWDKYDFIVKYRNSHESCKKDFNNSYSITHWAYSWRDEYSNECQEQPYMIVKKNNINKTCVKYGSKKHNKIIDVTDKFLQLFIKNNELFIPKNTYFNSHFGDPSPHIMKRIYIQYNNHDIILNEPDPRYNDIVYKF